jgi:hypothetical protein
MMKNAESNLNYIFYSHQRKEIHINPIPGLDPASIFRQIYPRQALTLRSLTVDKRAIIP